MLGGLERGPQETWRQLTKGREVEMARVPPAADPRGDAEALPFWTLRSSSSK